MADMDFIGFTYNGKHSWYDLGIYRISKGSRYNDTLTPSLEDKTAEIPGCDGQYHFSTRAKNKTFSVSYAFDSLTESGLRQLKQVFNGREICDLIFDEAPYKTWSAKITGNAQINHLCFTDSEGNRIYKGEGELTFTCYWPYARTSDLSGITNNATKTALPRKVKVACDLFTQGGENYTLINKMGAELSITYAEWDGERWSGSFVETIENDEIKKFDKPAWIQQFYITSNATSENYIQLGEDRFYYTNNKTFEYFGTCDGRNINHYSPILFPNKKEWASASGLFITPKCGENYGDIPASFVYSYNSQLSIDTPITLDGIGQIIIKEDCSNLEWNSKTGIVTAEIDFKRRPIYYSGNSLAEIPVGNNSVGLSIPSEGKLIYNYWYY